MSAQRFDRHTLEQVIVPRFIRSHAAPSPLIAQVGRWRLAVCPQVSGLKPAFNEFVARRVARIAEQVGAPAARIGDKCAINVEIVFTPSPQPLLDHIAKAYPLLLGFYTPEQRTQVTTMARPVQAWYMTGTRAANGFSPPVSGLSGGQSFASGPPPMSDGVQLDSATDSGVGGHSMIGGNASGRLGEGLTSEFLHVLVIVDQRSVKALPLSALADYIAMLSLTRMSSLDTCSELPSIIDLLSTGCGQSQRREALTPADGAFLRALYHADLEPKVNVEQGDLRDRMLEVIEKH